MNEKVPDGVPEEIEYDDTDDNSEGPLPFEEGDTPPAVSIGADPSRGLVILRILRPSNVEGVEPTVENECGLPVIVALTLAQTLLHKSLALLTMPPPGAPGGPPLPPEMQGGGGLILP